MRRHLPLLSGCMKAVANVWGNSLAESLRIPFICRVFPWNTAPWTSASLPKPRRCQVTLSPSHTFSPGKLPNIIPLMAAKENAIDSLQVRDSFCAHALTGQNWQRKRSFFVIHPEHAQDTLQDSCTSCSMSHLLPPASLDFRPVTIQPFQLPGSVFRWASPHVLQVQSCCTQNSIRPYHASCLTPWSHHPLAPKPLPSSNSTLCLHLNTSWGSHQTHWREGRILCRSLSIITIIDVNF